MNGKCMGQLVEYKSYLPIYWVLQIEFSPLFTERATIAVFNNLGPVTLQVLSLFGFALEVAVHVVPPIYYFVSREMRVRA